MDIPEIPELEKCAADIVTDASADGTLRTLTPRIIRQKIEEKFGLEKGCLDDSEYKGAIKAAIDATQKSLKDKKDKSDIEESDTKAERHDEEPAEGGTKSKGKKRKSDETKGKKKNTDSGDKKKKNQRKSEETFKSAETIATSDEDEASAPPPKKAKKQLKTDDGVPSGSDSEGAFSQPPKKRKRTQSPDSSHKKPSSSIKNETNTTPNDASVDVAMEDPGSDTGLSDLVDEPPKRKSKSKDKEKEKKAPKEKKGKKNAVTLSKDEETIKRLKGLVNACGVRKVWAKAFKGIEDEPNKQIKMLKEMLADLGMTGRLSMEQAKEIKAKRELAQELEDVQTFEKAIVKQSSRRSRQTSKSQENDEASEEEEDVKVPTKRRSNARQSIMAFLEDQSDSE
ncbi:hypothetical protein VNI00_003008 [Paramarasmius palmivorus]|uniref:DEK C-terminal domain-containing protein n=1 Tax=Paramarasmius palmivorus TaxID=297713 RepID=A0AAW0DWM2_9AGAR